MRVFLKVRRLVRWKLYLLSFAYNFCREKKPKKCFFWLWQFKSNTLINNHFIIKYFKNGMVTLRSRRSVPWYSTTTLFFKVTFHTLIHFWLGTQTLIPTWILVFDKLLNEIDNFFLRKGVIRLTMSAYYAMISSNAKHIFLSVVVH